MHKHDYRQTHKSEFKGYTRGGKKAKYLREYRCTNADGRCTRLTKYKTETVDAQGRG